MEVIVSKHHPEQATRSIDGIYQELVALLAGTPLSETEGMIYSIDPDSREAYVKINVDRLEEAIGRLCLVTKPVPKRFMRDQRKQGK